MTDQDLLSQLLELVDVGVVVVDPGTWQVRWANSLGRRLWGASPPAPLVEAIEMHVTARRAIGRVPAPTRVKIDSNYLWVRAIPVGQDSGFEAVFVREEVKRTAEGFRALNARFGLSRREFDVVMGLRRGLTNRQIADELGLAEGTVARHVHRILERFSVQNRTALVNAVERLLA